MAEQTRAQQVQPRRSRLVTALCAWLLLSPCCSYAVLGDAPLVPLLAAIALSIAIIVPVGVRVSTRSVIYTVTTAFLVAVILDQVYKVDGDRFFMPLPTEVVFPFLIAAAVCATFFTHTSRVLTAILVLSVVALMIQGSALNDPDNKRLLLTAFPARNRFWVFGIALALQMMAFIPLLQYALPRRAHLRPSRLPGGRRLAFAGSVAILVALTVINCSMISRYYRVLETVLDPVIRLYMSQRHSKVVFPSRVNLYRTVMPEIKAHRDRVVLRSRAQHPPGYLRGRVYHKYHNGEWEGLDLDRQLPMVMAPNGSLAAATFSWHGGNHQPAAAKRIDIFPVPRFSSDVLFVTGNTEAVELIAEEVRTNHDGVLRPNEWDAHGGYTLFSDQLDQAAAFNEVAAAPDPEYLAVPLALAGDLQQIAGQALAEQRGTTRERVLDLANWLRNNYAYKLGVRRDTDRDPVLDFLATERQGHCEFFASAAALLLRTQGVPTRYVTGFYCGEPHPYESVWLARLGDCHAWAEAYLPEEQRWMLIEATPAVGVPAGHRRGGAVNDAFEYLTAFWVNLFALVKRGYFAAAVISALSACWHFITWLFWRGPWWLGWGLPSVVVIWLLYRRRGPRSSEATSLPLRQLQTAWLNLERALERFKLQRDETTTVRELAWQAQARNLPFADSLSELTTEFERLRYAPAGPEPTAVANYAARLAAWVQQLPRSRQAAP